MYGRFNLLVSPLGKLRAEPGLTLKAISVSINAANAAAVNNVFFNPFLVFFFLRKDRRGEIEGLLELAGGPQYS